jgi:hypothetical protein
MCAAPGRIWFTIANNQDNQQSSHQPDHHLPSTDHLPADDRQPISHRHEVSPKKPDAIPGLTTFSTGAHVYPTDSKTTLVDGYTQLVTDRVHAGWSCHLITILFSRLPGPRGSIISRMRDGIQRVYSTLVTRVHRKPRTAPADELPVLVGAIDLPVYKRDRSSAPKVYGNGGHHFHGILLVPPVSRLKESMVDHFQINRNLYVGKPIQRIDVRPIVRNNRRVVDYVLKTILNGRLTYDDAMLVLPRAHGELEDRSAGDGIFPSFAN